MEFRVTRAAKPGSQHVQVDHEDEELHARVKTPFGLVSKVVRD